MIGEYLEEFTFSYLIDRALQEVPDTVDKREGSIIYDALAPACYELAEYYMQLRKILADTFIKTASGEYLDLRVMEQGIQRFGATYATKKGVFINNADGPAIIPIGSRFSVISDTITSNYIVSEAHADSFGVVEPGSYNLVCEEAGTVGNNYVGALIPITYIPNLKSANMTDLIISARDIETDDDLRDRYLLAINEKPFGGNIAQYYKELREIDGVGDVQVYPVWDGAGTVKLSIVDNGFNKATPEFVNIVQNIVDPENGLGQQGTGIGLAPIGHKVTVTTPNEVVVAIESTVVLMAGVSLPQVSPLIEAAIEDYLIRAKKGWGLRSEVNTYSLDIYISQINAAILGVAGVANVTNTKINGATNDLSLEQTAANQEIPQMGAVVINE